MIPAFNEEETVGHVVRDVPRRIEGIDVVKVLLVDDGSTDLTIQRAKDAGVDFVFDHERNIGLGVAFKHGLEKALSLGADIIVSIDADMQYSSSEIPLLVRPILEGEADIVLGDRQLDSVEHMPMSKKIGNGIATWVTRRASGLPVYDAQTGFRAFSRKAALEMNLNSSHTYVHESLVQAGAKKLRVTDVPVTFRERNGESRLISSVWGYAISAGTTLIKSYAQCHPIRAFAVLTGVIAALIGLALTSRLLVSIEGGEVASILSLFGSASILLVIGLQAIVFGTFWRRVRRKRGSETNPHFES
jgi:glycosyltransferase involved in cell wall biosynthesis